MSSTSNNAISKFEAFAEKAGQDIGRTVSNIQGKSGVEEWKMAVIAINKILDEVRAKYLPGAKVPLVVIAAEMQIFPIDQVPKSILKGKGVDPLEQGGAMEAGGIKLEGKQASDGNWGGKGGEKGKKKEKKEKKEKKIERVATGSDGGQEFWVVGSESGGPISGGYLGAGTAEEHRGRTRDRKPKKHSRTQSQSQSVVSPTQGFDVIEPDHHLITPRNPNPKSLQQLLRPLHLANEGLHEKAPEGYPCQGMPPLSPGKGCLKSIPAGEATPGAVEGSSPSPGTSKGFIPRPFQRPNSSIRLGDFEAAGYPLEAGPKLGTWPFPIKEGQGLGLQIEAKDAFAHPKCKIQ
ncbi:hypothetical protein PAXRUDRAFT_21743 [Paxillus rubicundulus Ve08.2h10]|uniref:Uncharacterized protein n=1 Tax=Paxillus rubicundulus Ve08.2h10 TaxID=930991 RepID=A0A0D0CAN8_9AGAM|nr:hypothetical protein PAXRUDRAFT_21743 [Paxillus rubicundulus Ve08.2h10]